MVTNVLKLPSAKANTLSPTCSQVLRKAGKHAQRVHDVTEVHAVRAYFDFDLICLGRDSRHGRCDQIVNHSASRSPDLCILFLHGLGWRCAALHQARLPCGALPPCDLRFARAADDAQQIIRRTRRIQVDGVGTQLRKLNRRSTPQSSERTTLDRNLRCGLTCLLCIPGYKPDAGWRRELFLHSRLQQPQRLRVSLTFFGLTGCAVVA